MFVHLLTKFLLFQAMAHGDHIINNKKIDPKKAKMRHGKIFVGGLSAELSDDDIKNFFAQFGTVSIRTVFFFIFLHWTIYLA